jgi:hypothetical protein
MASDELRSGYHIAFKIHPHGLIILVLVWL